MFAKLKQQTGIKRLNCHLGRHTFATNYIIDGNIRQELQLALAHETEYMSKEYLHLAEKTTFIRRGADSHLDKMINTRKSKTKLA